MGSVHEEASPTESLWLMDCSSAVAPEEAFKHKSELLCAVVLVVVCKFTHVYSGSLRDHLSLVVDCSLLLMFLVPPSVPLSHCTVRVCGLSIYAD